MGIRRMEFFYRGKRFTRRREGDSEHEINIYIPHSRIFEWIECMIDRRWARSMDRLETSLFKTLDSEWNTSNPEFLDLESIFSSYIFWITFEWDFTFFWKWKSFHEFRDFLSLEYRWCPSSEIECTRFDSGIVHLEIVLYFFMEICEVVSSFRSVVSWCHCEFTVGTLLSAKWDVEIKALSDTGIWRWKRYIGWEEKCKWKTLTSKYL